MKYISVISCVISKLRGRLRELYVAWQRQRAEACRSSLREAENRKSWPQSCWLLQRNEEKLSQSIPHVRKLKKALYHEIYWSEKPVYSILNEAWLNEIVTILDIWSSREAEERPLREATAQILTLSIYFRNVREGWLSICVSSLFQRNHDISIVCEERLFLSMLMQWENVYLSSSSLSHQPEKKYEKWLFCWKLWYLLKKREGWLPVRNSDTMTVSKRSWENVRNISAEEKCNWS